MATRSKTIEYWFAELASVTDNTDTNFTQITVYIPETSLTFRSAFLEVVIQDAEATANNVSRRQVSLQLGAAGYSAVNNTNAMSNTSEQKWIQASGDFTSYFTSNWSGSSMTCDARILCDSAIGTPVQNWRCATAKLVITYEYDDTSSTHIKTIYWPVKTPITALGTSKPGTANDTGIPAFDTDLPEASKTIRQITLVVQGNNEYSGTTDHTMSWEFDTAGGVYTTGSHELALNTSCWFRHCQIQTFATNSTHSFYIWSSTAAFAHCQAWFVITYEFNPSTSTTIWNSLLMPASFDSAAGGTTNADYQRTKLDLWVEEPTTITVKRSAIQLYWEQAAAITGAQYRVNSGNWSGAITSTAAVVAGSCGASHECTADITLARGVNSITSDVYRTGTADLMVNLNGLWIINYTSGKATAGPGVHNHTILDMIHGTGTGAAVNEVTTTKQFYIPETAYYFNNIGINTHAMFNVTSIGCGAALVERLSGEGGIKWEQLYANGIAGDALTGVRVRFAADQDIFKRFVNDFDSTRLDIETSRRYREQYFPATFNQAVMFMTYHAITFTVSGTISRSASGTVTLYLISNYDKEIKQSTSRSGDGAYSFTVYDDTQYVWVEAYEDATHVFRSALGYPS